MTSINPPLTGIVAVYKPKGITSHAVVGRLRRLTGEKRIGHAGTLDPLATGVLVVGIGRQWTKQLGTIVEQEKEYLATVRLDGTSPTDDAEGEIQPIKVPVIPSQDAIEAILPRFLGMIMQVPPVYSAVKVHGQTAYRLARRGQHVVLEPRPREVRAISILDYSWPELRLSVTTGKGVYIRSLARDIGAALSVGGYLTSLERIRVGQFTKDTCRHDLFND